MPNQPRYGLARRLLFPYSGEEALTFIQGLRVITTWALFFAMLMLFLTLPVVLAIVGTHSLEKLEYLLLVSFFSGACIFGGLAGVVVSMSNRVAQIRQKQKATKSSTSGGQYGS